MSTNRGTLIVQGWLSADSVVHQQVWPNGDTKRGSSHHSFASRCGSRMKIAQSRLILKAGGGVSIARRIRRCRLSTSTMVAKFFNQMRYHREQSGGVQRQRAVMVYTTHKMSHVIMCLTYTQGSLQTCSRMLSCIHRTR